MRFINLFSQAALFSLLTNASSLSTSSNFLRRTEETNSSSPHMNAAEIKGYKFFDSDTGAYIPIRGIDYYPRPNTGKYDANSFDFFNDKFRDVWERDIKYFKELGVNAIRLYSVDPEQNHDNFMCALQAAGIYVLVELTHEDCAVTKKNAPDCYATKLKKRGMEVIQTFSKYENTLGYSAGNEVNNYLGLEEIAPCQKKFLRDMRAYIRGCPHMRQVPVGLVVADIDRERTTQYFNCRTDPNDELENTEWFGINAYVQCDGDAQSYSDAPGFQLLEKSFRSFNTSVPVLLTEFGCLSDTFPTVDGYEGQRNFRQAEWLNEPELQEQFAGAFVFEYSIEMRNAKSQSPYPFKKFGHQNYGVGYFSPEDCDEGNVTCKYNPLPGFYNLKDAYAAPNPETSLTKDEFEPESGRNGVMECPSDIPKLSDLKWKPDKHSFAKCPPKRLEMWTCATRSDFEHGGMSPIAVALIVLFSVASCTALGYVGYGRYRVASSSLSSSNKGGIVCGMLDGSKKGGIGDDESHGLMRQQTIETDYQAISSGSDSD